MEKGQDWSSLSQLQRARGLARRKWRHGDNSDKFDFWLSEGKRCLSEIRSDRVIPRARRTLREHKAVLQGYSDSLTDRSLLRDEASKTWRPRLLRSVVNNPSAVDRDALIDPPFHRERREAAVGFQVQHPLKKDETRNYYINKNRERPPFITRDQYDLLFLRNLEVHKRDLGELEYKEKWTPKDEKHEEEEEEKCCMFFHRNWPMTEENKGRDYREFIRR